MKYKQLQDSMSKLHAALQTERMEKQLWKKNALALNTLLHRINETLSLAVAIEKAKGFSNPVSVSVVFTKQAIKDLKDIELIVIEAEKQ